MTAARKAQIGLLRLGGWVRPPLSLGTPAWARPPLFVLVGSLAILFLMKSLCDCILECGYLLIYLYRAAEAGELKSRACWCRARRMARIEGVVRSGTDESSGRACWGSGRLISAAEGAHQGSSTKWYGGPWVIERGGGSVRSISATECAHW